jgi:hypothetical protein
VSDQLGVRWGVALGGAVALLTGLVGLAQVSGVRRRLPWPRRLRARAEVVAVPVDGAPLDPELVTHDRTLSA